MFEREMEIAIRAAKKAGQFLKEQSAFSLDSQIGKDIKLSVDRESERIILETLHPTGISVLTEESGMHSNDTDLMWVVDPLDGTANYWRGMRELCCVSIALWKGTLPILGVIYRFQTDDLFTGLVGDGSYLNGVSIHTSSVSKLENAFLTTGLPVHFDYGHDSLDLFNKRMRLFKKVRMFGTAALMGVSVAAGRTDVYSESNIMFWDIAASTAISVAAGGVYDLIIKDDYQCDCILFANESLKCDYYDKIY